MQASRRCAAASSSSSALMASNEARVTPWLRSMPFTRSMAAATAAVRAAPVAGAFMTGPLGLVAAS